MRCFFQCCAGVLLILVRCETGWGQDAAGERAEAGIVPRPLRMEARPQAFVLTSSPQIAADSSLLSSARFLSARLSSAGGLTPRILPTRRGAKRGIILRVEHSGLSGRESYRLQVTSKAITIIGGGEAGVFYGVQTLLQLLPPEVFAQAGGDQARWRVPGCLIEDSPRFPWRGMHLDVSRHFFPPAFIKKYLDLLAMHKMNVFHWHLTDDQGWRIEIPKYPKLTSVGAWRVDREDRDWLDRPPQQPGERATYGGFYTTQEIRDIVRYAESRRITIVPEIEMPAHTLAALVAYPQYSCTGGPFTVPPGSYWPISSIFCAGNDSTFTFLQDVLSEVMDLFPGPYIHIGGDEADKSEWKKCPRCQERIVREGLRGTDELQSYFVRRIGAFVASRGRTIIGWDEILEGGLAPRSMVMSWRGAQGGIEASRIGHDVVMTPGEFCYFNRSQGKGSDEPPGTGGYTPLTTVYAFEPVPDGVPENQARHIVGAQGCLWSEYLDSPEQAEYMLLPRLAAISEVLWSPRTERDWRNFALRLPRQLKRYDALGVRYSLSAYSVAIATALDTVSRTIRVQLSTVLPVDHVRFTLDGSTPDTSSPLYDTAFTVKSSTTIKALAEWQGRLLPALSEEMVKLHRGVLRPVRLRHPPTKYSGGGEHALNDGLLGSMHYDDGRWVGFEGVDFDATMDLGEVTQVRHLSARFLQDISSWIFYPTSVTFSVSDDGVRFAVLDSCCIPTATGPARPTVWEYVHAFEGVRSRYLRCTARTLGSCPPWHPGAGGRAWLFVDELVVD